MLILLQRFIYNELICYNNKYDLLKYQTQFVNLTIKTCQCTGTPLQVKNVCRPLSFTMLLLEAEFDKLVDQGILTPVQHAHWAAPIMSIMKADQNRESL